MVVEIRDDFLASCNDASIDQSSSIFLEYISSKLQDIQEKEFHPPLLGRTVEGK